MLAGALGARRGGRVRGDSCSLPRSAGLRGSHGREGPPGRDSGAALPPVRLPLPLGLRGKRTPFIAVPWEPCSWDRSPSRLPGGQCKVPLRQPLPHCVAASFPAPSALLPAPALPRHCHPRPQEPGREPKTSRSSRRPLASVSRVPAEREANGSLGRLSSLPAALWQNGRGQGPGRPSAGLGGARGTWRLCGRGGGARRKMAAPTAPAVAAEEPQASGGPRPPVCLLVLGMAGSGKTTFVQVKCTARA